MASARQVYRVLFFNQGQVYEIYARQVYQSELYGFVEVEDFLFGERSQVVVDPGEEKLKKEFAGVTRTYIPMQALIRIDEVEKAGPGKVTEAGEGGANIHNFPLPFGGPGRGEGR